MDLYKYSHRLYRAISGALYQTTLFGGRMSTYSDLDYRGRRFAITSAIYRLTIFFVLLIVLAHSSLVDSATCRAKNLRFVILVHRHGDRTPIYDYPNDPHKNHWGGSKGVLTNKGVDQLCNVGFTIKSRYSALLPEGGKYTPRNTRVITSPIERCEKSVGALLKCMTSIRKPDGNTEFKKQPVNFTKLSKKDDNILLQSMACPKYDAKMKELLEKPRRGTDVYNFNKKYASLYEYITRHSGKDVTNCVEAAQFYDTFRVQMDNNLRLPSWARSIYPDKLREVYEFVALLPTISPYMKRIKGGKLLTNIVTQLLRKKVMLTQKIQIYSGHDISLVNLFRGLGIEDQAGLEPGYGSMLAFELYDSNDECDDWILKIVYFRNANKKIPKEISIPSCSHPCKIEEFRGRIDDMWLSQKQYDSECRVN